MSSTLLEGIRVLDFGRYIAGPYCAALLGDLGADVIRIERLGGGEDRFLAPVTADGMGGLYLQLARNKRSLTLNPTKPTGREIVHRLVATADVVIANLPPTTLAAMGIDYDSVRAIRPDIIMTMVTAFGRGGPWSDKIGFDGLAQAMSGTMYLSGPVGEPTRSSAAFVDFATGALSAFATMAAMRHRDATGEGQLLEGALLKTALTMMNGTLIEQDLLTRDRESTHNRGQTSGPSDVYHCRDGSILAIAIGDPQWERWTKLVGRTDLLDDPRFATDLDRGDNGEILSEIMSEWCAERTVEEVMVALEEAKIPGGPVLSPQQALDHPHVQAIGFLEPVSYPGAPKTLGVAGFPVTMAAIDTSIRFRAPRVGEHTDEILAELGYDEEAVRDLRAARVV